MEWKGIDVSQHQGSNINFEKVKAAGVKFVIIRAGYGQYISQKDPLFESNYKKAKAAGLNVGVYWYSYAKTLDDVKKEAAVCLEAIKGKTFEMPIYFDLEEQSQFRKGKTFCSDAVKTFCNALEAAGYWAGLYISRSPLQSYITTEVAKRYALWIAEYNSRCNYSGAYGMWQYSDSGKVNGITGNVDMDICYIDYPSKIKAKGLNGFEKTATTKPAGDTYEVTYKTGLNIRAGAGVTNKVVGSLKYGEKTTVTEKKKVVKQYWGKLADGRGWICLTGFTKKVSSK